MEKEFEMIMIVEKSWNNNWAGATPPIQKVSRLSFNQF